VLAAHPREIAVSRRPDLQSCLMHWMSLAVADVQHYPLSGRYSRQNAALVDISGASGLSLDPNQWTQTIASAFGQPY
jgi:hypothetical protein